MTAFSPAVDARLKVSACSTWTAAAPSSTDRSLTGRVCSHLGRNDHAIMHGNDIGEGAANIHRDHATHKMPSSGR